jgi:zinc protease
MMTRRQKRQQERKMQNKPIVMLIENNLLHIQRVMRLFAIAVLAFSSTSLFATPQIQTWHTENGARVLFVPATEIPMLDVRIVFDAGTARDDNLSGLSVLTNGLLSEGAAGKTSQQIAEAFESVGAQIGYDAARDMALVGVRSLTESRYLSVAIETLKQVLTQPDFPQDAYQRELNRMKLAVKARKQSPAALANKAFYEAVYGDHPYASPASGTYESLEKMTLEDIRAFYSSIMSPEMRLSLSSVTSNAGRQKRS